jgi:H+/Na+-translocating ferredoxin:NAD+ oxidoreductase subunit G
MKKIIHILATLTIIGIISGAALAMVADWANPLIEANRKAETERAIFLVQPQGTSYEIVQDVSFDLYRVFDDTKNPVGFAMIYEGNGFQGNIRVMVGVKADLMSVTAMEVLEQTETPGLGTKILEEPFKGYFNGLSADPQINMVKGVEASQPNEVQAITGATISSKAIIDIINNGLQQLRKETGGER